MSWSLDFCLNCDKQTDEGLYCSLDCRSADRDRGESPFTRASDDQPLSSSTDSSSSSAPARLSIFSLPPAFDFSSTKPHESHTAPATPMQIRQPPRQTDAIEAWRRQTYPQLELEISAQQCFTFDHPFTSISPKTPYSSRPTSTNLSKATRDELRRYDDAFDRSRTRRQRTSLR